MRRRSAVALALFALFAALAAAAHADSCVGDPPCLATLQAAIDAAASSPGTDTITVGPGSFAGGTAGAGNPVRIIGAGRNRTTLTGTAPAPVLTLAASGSEVASLHVAVPAAPPGPAQVGLDLTGSGSDLLVDAADGTSHRVGVTLRAGGVLTGSTVAFPPAPGAPSTFGLKLDGAGQRTVSATTIVAELGIELQNAATLVLDRARVAAPQGLSSVTDTVATVDDTVFTVPPAEIGTPFAVSSDDSPESVVILRNVTASGPGSGAGIQATTGGKVGVGSSVIRNFATDLSQQSAGTLDASYSAYATSTGTIGGGTGNIAGAGDPGFLDAAGGDFRLPYNSVLVDNGDPGPVPGPVTDLAGGARLVNGRVDIGAFEYQRRPPVPAIAVAPAEPRVDDRVAFDASGSSDADPGDTPLSYVWAFDDGESARGIAVTHVFRTPGSHRATLTVTDPAGESASLSRIVVISARGGGRALPPVPTLSSFTTTNSSFAVRAAPRAAGARKPKPKRGTTFRYTLRAAARSVKISFEALLPGKRSGRSCVKPTRRLKRARGCTRSVAKGGIEGPAASGRNSLAWNGRIKRKALPVGRYKATARATDRFGRLSNARTLTVRIVASR